LANETRAYPNKCKTKAPHACPAHQSSFLHRHLFHSANISASPVSDKTHSWQCNNEHAPPAQVYLLSTTKAVTQWIITIQTINYPVAVYSWISYRPHYTPCQSVCPCVLLTREEKGTGKRRKLVQTFPRAGVTGGQFSVQNV